jgi:hypothetical protein
MIAKLTITVNLKNEIILKQTKDKDECFSNTIYNENEIGEKLLSLKNVIFPDSNCSDNICSDPFGQCINNNSICKCNDGYLSVPFINTDNSILCSYQQKLQSYSLILESILMCGIGHLYAHRVVMGVLKLIFFSLVVYNIILQYKSYQKNMFFNRPQPKVFSIHDYISYIFISLFIFIHIYDVIMIMLNKYPDGFGIPLKPLVY